MTILTPLQAFGRSPIARLLRNIVLNRASKISRPFYIEKVEIRLNLFTADEMASSANYQFLFGNRPTPIKAA